MCCPQVRQPGRLLALPFAEIGTLLAKAQFAWHLPGGRSPDDHHFFRIPAPVRTMILCCSCIGCLRTCGAVCSYCTTTSCLMLQIGCCMIDLSVRVTAEVVSDGLWHRMPAVVNLHHLRCCQEGEGAVQGPISVAAIAKSSGFDVALDVILGPPAPITGPLTGSGDESGAPVVFFGDYQVRSNSKLLQQSWLFPRLSNHEQRYETGSSQGGEMLSCQSRPCIMVNDLFSFVRMLIQNAHPVWPRPADALHAGAGGDIQVAAHVPQDAQEARHVLRAEAQERAATRARCAEAAAGPGDRHTGHPDW